MERDEAPAERLVWVCPRCGAKLVGQNMWHACGPYTVEGFLEGRGPRACELFDACAAMVRSIGAFEFAPARARVAFMVRVRFAGIDRVSDRGLTLHFWLKHRIDSPRFRQVELLPPDN
jgi:hypothetical protein